MLFISGFRFFDIHDIQESISVSFKATTHRDRLFTANWVKMRKWEKLKKKNPSVTFICQKDRLIIEQESTKP